MIFSFQTDVLWNELRVIYTRSSGEGILNTQRFFILHFMEWKFIWDFFSHEKKTPRNEQILHEINFFRESGRIIQ